MENLWNIARKNPNNCRFAQAASFSPYIESTSEWLKEEDGHTVLTMNAMYRYGKIVSPLFYNHDINDNVRNKLFDIIMHYLVELEYRNGIFAAEYAIRKQMNSMHNGLYGEAVSLGYNILPEDKKYALAVWLTRQNKTDANVSMFAGALTEVFTNAVIYKDKNDLKTIIMYAGTVKSDDNLTLANMVQQLFCPLDYELKIYWDKHFVVLGQEQTSVIGDTMI